MEDDLKISSFVKLGLEKNDCFVEVAYDSAIGERLALKKKYDVIILDVIVPGINGFELCKRLRNNGIGTPIKLVPSADANSVTPDCGHPPCYGTSWLYK